MSDLQFVEYMEQPDRKSELGGNQIAQANEGRAHKGMHREDRGPRIFLYLVAYGEANSATATDTQYYRSDDIYGVDKHSRPHPNPSGRVAEGRFARRTLQRQPYQGEIPAARGESNLGTATRPGTAASRP